VQATTDALTGLANRVLLMERAEAALAGAGPDRAVAVLLLDLDGFKTVNDSLGHAAGDELLVAVSRRIQAVLRPGDIAARLGGDEFAVLLDPVAGDDEAAGMAEALLARLADPVVIEGRRVVVNGSAGVAVWDGRRAPSELLRDADVAMYAAKRAGKGRYAVFEPGMHATALERLELEQALREALARPDGGIEVVYQPIVALHTGRPVAVEALPCLSGHDGLSPARLSALADEAGLAAALGERVLRTACRQLGRWRAELGPRAPVTVNVNLPARLVLEPGLPGLVGRALEAGGLDAGHLELELTEGALLEGSPGVPSTLAALRGAGIRLAIDHFGAGSSSLSWLRRVSVDTLKIDRSVIAGLAGGGEGATLAAAVIRLGFALDLQVVATGVDGDAELEALRALRCPLGQGGRLGPARPAAGLTALLRDGRAARAATD
jgi:diguanylate cyclase (GGDEF)-like protein